MLFVNMSIDLVTGGGTAARTMSVAQSIRDDFKKECIVLATDQGVNKKAVSENNDPSLVLLHSIVNRFYIPYFSLSKLTQLVKRSEIIHLMSHWTIINVVVYFMARFYKKPYTFCPAGTLKTFGRSVRLKKLYNYFVGKKIVENAVVCIAITEKEKSDFDGFNIDSAKIITIPNGILPDDFYPNKAAELLFVEKFDLKGVDYILFMGRLNEIKGPDLLLNAFIRLSSEFKELHVVFAGPDEGMKTNMVNEVRKHGLEDRVHIIGHVDGQYKLGAYCGARLLAVPSRKEAMSIVALEAGSCGIPLILTTECGFDEVAEFGCEVVVASVDGLCLGIKKMLSAKNLESIGNNLREEIICKYTWEATARMYLEINDKRI